jgi:spermidine/putrescine transport system substrate-binding protein
MHSRCFIATLLATLVLGLLAACAGPTPPPTATPPPLAKELVLYNWVEYMPQSVLDAFMAEYGVKITYLTYDSQEEAVEKIKAGLVYDVAVIENDLLQSLIKEGLLAEIDYRQAPNFRNVMADFRDLTFDPGNRHSVPYSWGTTGLLVRSDLIESPVTHWADLWKPRYAGKIAVRTQPTELISIALKSLGYPLNSENPQELEAALQRLIDLKSSVVFVDVEVEKAIAPLVSGEVVIMAGWPGDALYARGQNDAIRYVLPEEGSML